MNQKGLTLLECVIASFIVIIFFYLAIQSNVSFTKVLSSDRERNSLLAEHQSVRHMVQRIPALAASRHFLFETPCVTSSGPHPYGLLKYNLLKPVGMSGVTPILFKNDLITPNCSTDTVTALGAPSSGQVLEIKKLSDLVYEWPSHNAVIQGEVSPSLDPDFFASKIAPQMALAGCLSCHNGSSDPKYRRVAGLNFSSYTDVTVKPISYGGTQTAPLSSRAMFASALGQMLIKSPITISDVFIKSRSVTHTVTFTQVDTATNFANTAVAPNTLAGDCSLTCASATCASGTVSSCSITPQGYTASVPCGKGCTNTNYICTGRVVSWVCSATAPSTAGAKLIGFNLLSQTMDPKTGKLSTLTSSGVLP